MNEENRAAKQRRKATIDDADDTNTDMQDTKANKQSGLSVSVDKAELVRRAVAHAAAAAIHFGDDDDADDDENDGQGNPDIVRNLKAELGVASEQSVYLEEAPDAT